MFLSIDLSIYIFPFQSIFMSYVYVSISTTLSDINIRNYFFRSVLLIPFIASLSFLSLSLSLTLSLILTLSISFLPLFLSFIPLQFLFLSLTLPLSSTTPHSLSLFLALSLCLSLSHSLSSHLIHLSSLSPYPSLDN